MTTLYLIRHGETDGNLSEQFQGIIDNPLNNTGLLQAKLVGEAMKDFPLDVIYSSPLKRALQTAEAIANHHALTPILHKGLQEIHGGDLEGRRIEELLQEYPECINNMMHKPALVSCPGGETMRQVFDRASCTIAEIVQDNIGKTIAVTSHGCLISAYLHFVSRKPFEDMPRLIVANTAINKFVYNDDLMSELIFSNEHSHLTEGKYIHTSDMGKSGRVVI